MFTICYRHRPSRRSPGRRSDGPGQGPVKPESAGFGPVTGKTRGFLADTIYENPKRIQSPHTDSPANSGRSPVRECAIVETASERLEAALGKFDDGLSEPRMVKSVGAVSQRTGSEERDMVVPRRTAASGLSRAGPLVALALATAATHRGLLPRRQCRWPGRRRPCASEWKRFMLGHTLDRRM